MSSSMASWLDAQAAVREHRGLVRAPSVVDAGVVDLASNDYLGLGEGSTLG
ncbi:hypothetical protein AAHB34_04950 [Paenarthrobacter ureafaciens]